MREVLKIFYAAVIGSVFGFGVGYYYGADSVNTRWEREKEKVRILIAEVEASAAQISALEVELAAKAKETVRTVFKDRIVYRDKEVPVEVRIREDSECVVPARFIRMWNSANRAELPGTASEPDDAANRTEFLSASESREAVGH